MKPIYFDDANNWWWFNLFKCCFNDITYYITSLKHVCLLFHHQYITISFYLCLGGVLIIEFTDQWSVAKNKGLEYQGSKGSEHQYLQLNHLKYNI